MKGLSFKGALAIALLFGMSSCSQDVELGTSIGSIGIETEEEFTQEVVYELTGLDGDIYQKFNNTYGKEYSEYSFETHVFVEVVEIEFSISYTDGIHTIKEEDIKDSFYAIVERKHLGQFLNYTVASKYKSIHHSFNNVFN